MNIYKISRNIDSTDYDVYDSAVVVAESHKQARSIHPDGRIGVGRTESVITGWTVPEKIFVELIGTYVGVTDPGVICASFNAG